MELPSETVSDYSKLPSCNIAPEAPLEGFSNEVVGLVASWPGLPYGVRVRRSGGSFEIHRLMVEAGDGIGYDPGGVLDHQGEGRTCLCLSS